MPFKSKAQSRAAFGGYLGSAMKEKAAEFASKTDYKHLPNKKKKKEKLGSSPFSKKSG
jgi:hypothetical protein